MNNKRKEELLWLIGGVIFTLFLVVIVSFSQSTDVDANILSAETITDTEAETTIEDDDISEESKDIISDLSSQGGEETEISLFKPEKDEIQLRLLRHRMAVRGANVEIKSEIETADEKSQMIDEELPQATDMEPEAIQETGETETNLEAEAQVPTPEASTWNGQALTAWLGRIHGPSGDETYYNLNMSGVVSIMRGLGYSEEEYPYWIREDGVKMFGPYVMCAANLDIRPRGSLVQSSLGMAIVCDTGSFAYSNPYQLDIAVNW